MSFFVNVYQLLFNILSTFYQLFINFLSTFYQHFINFINILSTVYQLLDNVYQLFIILIELTVTVSHQFVLSAWPLGAQLLALPNAKPHLPQWLLQPPRTMVALEGQTVCLSQWRDLCKDKSFLLESGSSVGNPTKEFPRLLITWGPLAARITSGTLAPNLH